MGLDSNACRFLLMSAWRGARFERSLCLGRLNLSLSPSMMRRALDEFGFPTSAQEIESLFKDSSGYVESFLKKVGAETIQSVDATDYEGATDHYDLNNGLPAHFRCCFDAVIDGGTLEHVFNLPVAFKASMDAVKVGGYFFSFTQCNNAMGHGFYQLSPEFFYRTLSENNGFQLYEMILAEGSFGKVPWFRVANPSSIGRRVELVNDVQTYLLVAAQRIRDTSIFSEWPQQSDYATAWECKSPDQNFTRITRRSFDLREHTPSVLKRLVRLWRLASRRRFEPPCYKAVNPAELAREPFKSS
jgi:hypothetical protein